MNYVSLTNKKRGLAIPGVLVFAFVFTLIITGLIGAFGTTLESSRNIIAREQALQIAEAGVEYYRWHLAHAPEDYQDGTSNPATSPNQEGLLLWLSADDINGDGTASADDTDVSEWVDKSPQANNVSEINGESVPKKITDNGIQAVEFSNDRLRSDNFLYPDLPIEDVEIFLMARTRTTGDNGYAFRTRGRPIHVRLPWGNDKVRVTMENGSNGYLQTDWSQSTSDYYLWNFKNSTTHGKFIRVNGTEIAETSENATGPNNSVKEIVLGGHHNKKQDYQDINIAEILIYDRTLSSEERSTVEKYLDCKYDVTSRSDCGSYEPGETYGPFTHEFTGKDGLRIGEFDLYITAPPIGSTIVSITSTGKVDGENVASRTIQTKLAIPSFIKYAFAANSEIRFGEGTEVFGPIHSNGGIRFDGVSHNLVTSARETYDDPDHSGSLEFGVHTHVSPQDPLPPNDVPVRLDVFKAGREFPVPAVDFAGMISDLSDMKDEAISDGEYFSPSGELGYRIVLKTNNTFEIHRVSTLVSPDWSCYDEVGEDGWGTWSINTDSLVGTYDFPDNGVIFVEDHVWVEGVIDDARLTIAAATFPDTVSTRKNIIVNNDLTYSNYDGLDSIALIAQNNVLTGLVSENDLRIDAALIAQNGRIGRYYYRPDSWWNDGCEPYAERSEITLYGTIASHDRYGFAWTDGTGYDIRNITYDSNLLYSPPPSFPLTTDQYEIISWEEIKE